MYIDWTYVYMVLPAVLFALWADRKVQGTYKKYRNQYNVKGISGAQAARFVLDKNGLSHVAVEETPGTLTDHFDPSANVIRLSSDVFSGTSSAAVGVACHEAGHAVQHAENYTPLVIRSAIVPITNFGSKLAVPLIILGLVLSSLSPIFTWLAYAGLICFALCTFFQLVTLPTEFNASKRALAAIEGGNLLEGEELEGARKVLKAAAMTYVAALAVSLAQLLRFVFIVGRRRD
ncbi:MAG: zinc metallopeptidase [Candidatus Limivicinus sp.]|jgi:Zn-dependent membrane protease YugP